MNVQLLCLGFVWSVRFGFFPPNSLDFLNERAPLITLSPPNPFTSIIPHLLFNKLFSPTFFLLSDGSSKMQMRLAATHKARHAGAVLARCRAGAGPASSRHSPSVSCWPRRVLWTRYWIRFPEQKKQRGFSCAVNLYSYLVFYQNYIVAAALPASELVTPARYN